MCHDAFFLNYANYALRAKLYDFASAHNSGSPEQSNTTGRHSAPILFCGRGWGRGGRENSLKKKKCDLQKKPSFITLQLHLEF